MQRPTAILTLFSILFLIIWGAGCENADIPQVPYELAIPVGFPQPDIPTDNTLTEERITLGKRLFHENALSRDYTIACASCHHQDKAFTDAEPLSIGIRNTIGNRNTPTLVNFAWQPYFFMEGGNRTLSMQSLGPIEEAHEMGFNAREAVDRLAMDSSYQRQARKAYDRNFDLFVLTRALEAFELTLISGNSPFDQYLYQHKPDALTETQKRGMEVFMGEKAACASCHPAPLFTDYSFQNIGLEQDYADHGRARVSGDSADIGKFKVPSLRNIALTAPYMHNGRFATLDEVVEHFNQGGVGHPNQSEVVKPLGLTNQEKEDLISFLEALTDQEFIENPAFR